MTNSVEERNQRNQLVMDALRANGGKTPDGRTLLIMHTKGAKSGKIHSAPVVYLPDGDRYVVFASMGGAPKSPAWYHNLIANPEIDIEVNGETVPVRAIEIKGEAHDSLYARNVAIHPAFGEYQQNTTRIIPVIAFERR